MLDESPLPPLELWAGVECTVNRVGDAYFDQLERTGHATRLDDLDRFAALGIRALRYPLLWERIAPHGLAHADWRWADERLGRLRALGIRPIVGLCHHGSGPASTHLLDPAFADELARFAGAVAERYPWLDEYTPINEPLTTARFSGLYGHWYPHGRDMLTCVRALLNECFGIARAMRAIREINPTARLVQTEDLGRTFGTPPLNDQVMFENERRWLAFDLLCGRVDREHWLWGFLMRIGVREEELAPLSEAPCPPDVLGINHYLTSERFLDDRLDRYPPHTHGGNGRQTYADIEAVRVLAGGPAGPGELLREAWDRYRLPIAVTEVHLGCTREEQLRWLRDAWNAAHKARADGVDVRAVTAWSLLGAYDWHCLLTRCEDRYEPGVFDLRAPAPRPTALASLLPELAAGREPSHPVLATPGWWARPARLAYPPLLRDGSDTAWPDTDPNLDARPILITGEQGTIADAFGHACAARGLAHRFVTPDDPHTDEPSDIGHRLAAIRPWAVVDTGVHALRRGDLATEARVRERVARSLALAGACAEHGIALLLLSTDRVFDGTVTRPYVEDDPPTPVDRVGQIMARTEGAVLSALPAAFVVRTGPLFEPRGPNLVTTALRALERRDPIVLAIDEIVSPTYVPDLVESALDLLIDGERGLWHLTNRGAITRRDLLCRAADLIGLDTADVRFSQPSTSDGAARPRPTNRALDSERGWPLPTLDDALWRFAREWRHGQPTYAPHAPPPDDEATRDLLGAVALTGAAP